MKKSQKPVALVTGSGRGIGAAIALRLAAEGYAVAINATSDDPSRPDGCPTKVRETIEAAGGEADIFLADIGDPAGHRALVDAVVGRFGRIDLLVNNAGVAPSVRADVLEADEGSYDRLMRINLKGPYFLTQRVAVRMIESMREGIVAVPRVVFVTSISAYTSSTNRGDYCISKAGLSMACQLFADRLAEFGIPVVEIRPGIVKTAMTGGVKEKYDKLIGEGLLPMRRWGRPEDVAAAVAAVARGDLDYSAGAVIEVSGGFQLHRL
jgi:NAD(P)-dependent dehydrogenase (short-subunit alcohol dehydrogenase family)